MKHLKTAKACISFIDNSTMAETDVKEFLYGITHTLIAVAEQLEISNKKQSDIHSNGYDMGFNDGLNSKEKK